MLKLRIESLKNKSLAVDFGDDASDLICEMFDLMSKEGGIGLAANQVGIEKRIIVVNCRGFNSEIINPVITKASGVKKRSVEGCLSFKGKSVSMNRHKTITVEGFDRNWNPIKKNCSGILSYCIQHEVDHLNGKTII